MYPGTGSAQPGVSQHEALHDVGVEALEVVPGVALLTRDGGVTRAHVLTPRMTRAGGYQPGAREHSQPDTHSHILISHPPHLANLPV